MTTLQSAFAAAGLALLALPIHGGTIYTETFSNGNAGTPSALNGSTPDVTTGGAAWVASDWKENGTTATIATSTNIADDDSAFLPFTPVAGKVYTLSATMTAPTGGERTGWVAIGFAQTATTTGSFWNNNTAPWLLWRPAPAGTGQTANEVVTWLGPGTGATTPTNSASEGAYTGKQTFKIVLNTEGAAWTAEWFINDVSVRSETYGTNPTIAYVGFGRENGHNSAIDDFSLSDKTIVAASAPQLSGFTYNPATGACTVNLKGSPGTTYKLVEADDLDFSNPDQDPVPLTGVTVGAPVGTLPAATSVKTDGNGDASVEFNLGTTKDKSFIRAEETAP